MEVGRRDGGSRRTLSQINVTPFVDVMLVLLIIFMVTAPMMETGIEINLPETEQAPELQGKDEPVIVTLDRQGRLFVGSSAVEDTEKLIPVLMQMLKDQRDKEVFLEADRAVPYGEVMKVMAAIKGAGVEKLGMVSQLPETR